MTVPESKRSPNKLQAFVEARQLAVYTLTICANKRIFPGRFKQVTDEIAHDAWMIAKLIWSANEENVRRGCDPANWDRRLAKQNAALVKCKELLFEIEMCYEAFPKSKKKLQKWARRVKEVKDLTVRWRDSDAKRRQESRG